MHNYQDIIKTEIELLLKKYVYYILKLHIKYFLDMKKLFIFLLGIVLLGSATILNSSFTNTTNWTLYTQSQGVQIYYKVADCDDASNGLYQKFLILKLVNTTGFDLDISWKKDLWYDDVCTTCNDQSKEHKTKIILKANSTIEGNCNNKKLSIFSEFKNHSNVSKLTKFELNKLVIKPAL